LLLGAVRLRHPLSARFEPVRKLLDLQRKGASGVDLDEELDGRAGGNLALDPVDPGIPRRKPIAVGQNAQTFSGLALIVEDASKYFMFPSCVTIPLR